MTSSKSVREIAFPDPTAEGFDPKVPFEAPNGTSYLWNGWGWDVVPKGVGGGDGGSSEPDPRLPYLIETDKVTRSTKEVRDQGPEIDLVDAEGNYSNVKFEARNGVVASSTPSSIVIDGTEEQEAREAADNALNELITQQAEKFEEDQERQDDAIKEAAKLWANDDPPPDETYDFWFCTDEDDLTLYVPMGGDWVPASPPVSTEGLANDVVMLQEANNDVKRQLAYQTVEAQKADGKILDLEDSTKELQGQTKALEKTTEELHENQEAHAAQIDYNARENTKLRSRIGDVEHTVQSLEGSSPRRVFRFEWMGFGQSKPQNQAEFDQRKGKAWSEYSSEDKWINIHAEDQDGNLLVLPNFAKSYASMPIALCEEGATGDPTKDPKVLIDGRAAPIISDIDQSEREKTGNFQGIDARYFDAYVMHLTSSISKLKKNKIYTLTFGLPL